MSYNRSGILSHPLTHGALYRMIRLYAATYRFSVVHEQRWQAELERGRVVILCAFHQQFFAAIRHFAGYRQYQPGLMISQSRDGDIIAGVAKCAGWKTFRGSSSKDGSQALAQMVAHVREHRLCGHVVDGPRGPAGVVKMGLVRLAQLTNGVIAPFFAEADRAWYFNSWDKFQLPKPLARVTLRFQPLITVEKTEQREAVEQQRLRVEKIMRSGLIIRN